MKYLLHILAILLVTLLFSGCGDKGDNTASTATPTTITTVVDNAPILPAKYYGKWAYVNTGQEINIISTTDLDITEVTGDPNLLKVNHGSTSSYIVRSGLANTTVNGTLQTTSSSSSAAPGRKGSSFAGIGNISIILSNVLDKHIKETTTTRNDGSFTTTTLPTGTYNLEASDDAKDIKAIVDIVNQDNDIGVYKLTGSDLNNFKAELILNESYILSDGLIHEAILRIHNISNKIGYGLSYNIELNTTTKVSSFTEDSENALGSVKAKAYKDIPISFAFNTLATNMKEYGVNVTINDALGNQWIDTFKFNVHKGAIAVLISTKSAPIKGYIRNPINGELLSINTTDGKIILPLMPEDKPYTLVLSNPSFEDETVYSIGVNTLPDSFSGFKNTAAHEPNNNDALSTTLTSNQATVSYLHATDIDFFKIKTLEGTVPNASVLSFTNSTSLTAPVSAPTSVSASDATQTNKILITWSDISSETYYEIYQANELSGNYTNIVSVDENITSIDINASEIVDAQVYYYKIRGCNNVGCSPFSYANSGYYTNVVNVAPLANAGDDQNVTTGTTVLLSATSSTDTDGSISSYRWLENSVELSTDISFSKTFTRGVHELAVVVTDNRGATDTDTVTIISNNAPAFTSSTTFSIDENTYNVGNSIASDADNDTLTYSLVSGDISALSINSGSGLLQFNSGSYPDYETKTSYSLVVSVSDGIETVEQNLTINVNDVLDVKPSIVGTLSLNIPENTTPGAYLGNLSITDGDSPTLSVNILGVTKFEIDMNGNISLKSGETLDFETLPNTYSFYVKATNSSGDSNLGSVSISISNIIEPPFIKNKTIKLQESLNVGILDILKEGSENIVYSIYDGTDKDDFTLNSTTGALNFINNTKYDNPADSDTDNIYNLTIGLSGSASGFIYENITVEVEQIIHNGTTYSYVVSDKGTNTVWLDKNLGAVACTGSNDNYCKGLFYQWGREHDGHEQNNASFTTIQPNIITNTNALFVVQHSDWTFVDDGGSLRSANWSKTDGSSVCPSGYRVPTITELMTEFGAIRLTATTTDLRYSFLNLDSTYDREYVSGTVSSSSDIALWSSTTSIGGEAKYIYIQKDKSFIEDNEKRAMGMNVRCIRD